MDQNANASRFLDSASPFLSGSPLATFATMILFFGQGNESLSSMVNWKGRQGPSPPSAVGHKSSLFTDAWQVLQRCLAGSPTQRAPRRGAGGRRANGLTNFTPTPQVVAMCFGLLEV